MKSYVIIGATGNTGKPITLGLLEQGHTVRIIARNTARTCLLYTSPSPRDRTRSRMPSSA